METWKRWCGGLLFAALLAGNASGQDRPLALAPEDMVPVELSSVGVDPILGVPVVLLRDAISGDVVSILIGVQEAQAILSALLEIGSPRPMTHDLFKSVLDAAGLRLVRIFVDELSDNTYYGMLELEVAETGERIRVDSRPSDALALAVRTGAQILVAPDVLTSAQDRAYEALPDNQVVTALGITVVEATDELRTALGLPSTPGVLVRNAQARATAAGLHAGSLILTVDGEVPHQPIDFLEIIRGVAASETVRITFWLDGEIREIELPADLSLGQPPAEGQITT